ncbi:MAG: hypothetical protein IJV37_07170 [Bacteroidales bacterium]|nr:hypothetical protein [Bacteroidales bacterium]
MTCNRFLSSLLLACLISAPAMAQGGMEDFLLNSSRHTFRLNPALTPDHDFLSIGNASMMNRANIGASSLLFENGGKIVSGFHPSVPEEQFLGGLKPDNFYSAFLNYSLAAYGIRRGDKFHTFEVSLKSNAGCTIPKDVFAFIKRGVQGEMLNFGNSRTNADMYAEFAYGYTQKLSDIVTVGVRGKLLVGLFSFDAKTNRMNLYFQDNQMMTYLEAELNLTGRWQDPATGKKKGLRVPTGLGLGVDLGIAIQPSPYLTLSASVTDLGFMGWLYGKGGLAVTTFEMFDPVSYDSDKFSIAQIIGIAGSTAKEINETVKVTESGLRARALATPINFHLGAKYKMPFYDKLTVGLTGAATLYRTMNYMEARFGAAVEPLNWLELSANFGYNTYGWAYGMVGSFRIEKFRIRLALQNNFGGWFKGTELPSKPSASVITAGLTYDL